MSELKNKNIGSVLDSHLIFSSLDTSPISLSELLLRRGALSMSRMYQYTLQDSSTQSTLVLAGALVEESNHPSLRLKLTLVFWPKQNLELLSNPT